MSLEHSSGSADETVEVPDAAAIRPGEVRMVPLLPSAKGTPREALVLRDHGGVMRAYLNRCEHLPIPLDSGCGEYLDQTGRMLLCATHGALYRLEDGFCTEGPCSGRSLLALPIHVGPDGAVTLHDPRNDEPVR